MKEIPHNKQYPRRIKCVMDKWHSDHGVMGWLHGFVSLTGSALVEMDNDNRIRTVGNHYYVFDKNGEANE